MRCNQDGERVKAKWFCLIFKLGFLQLISKPFIILRQSLELALWIVLKQSDLYESKHVAAECSYMIHNPSFKMTTSFAIYLDLELTSLNFDIIKFKEYKFSKVCFWYNVKGCQYMVIYSNERETYLLIDSGY